MTRSHPGPGLSRRLARRRTRAALAAAGTCLVPLGAAPAEATTGLDAQVVGGEAFLSNGPVEVGSRGNGSFGSDRVPPAGYHPRDTANSGLLGFRVDRDQDGWGVGVDDGDFFVPGAPWEGFAVQVGNGTTPAWNDDITADVPGAWSAPTAAGAAATATWRSTGDVGGVQVTQVAEVAAGRLALDVTVTLTNTTGAPLADVYYERGVDPDNCWETTPAGACDSDGDGIGDGGHVYGTLNTIGGQVRAGDPVSVVSATQTDGTHLDLRTDDPDSIVRVDDGSWCLPGPEDLFAPTGSCLLPDAVGTALFGDAPVYLGVHLPALAPGGSHTTTFSYVLTAAAATAPHRPPAPVAAAGDGKATVTVAPPPTGPAPAGYRVTARPGGATCTVVAPATSCVVPGLANGTAHTFTATAHDGNGTSVASPASAPVVPTAPTPPPAAPSTTPSTTPADTAQPGPGATPEPGQATGTEAAGPATDPGTDSPTTPATGGARSPAPSPPAALADTGAGVAPGLLLAGGLAALAGGSVLVAAGRRTGRPDVTSRTGPR